MKFPDSTKEAIAAVRKKKRAGKEKLTMDDKLILFMADGKWHDGYELTAATSWRFGGYLHSIRGKGVEWEKERIPNVDSTAYRYRLVKE